MTYRQLLEILQRASEEQLNNTVTVYDPYEREYTTIIDTDETVVDDVLDKNHLFLVMKA